jgi:tetratricopeptide (TPR) repeat protein
MRLGYRWAVLYALVLLAGCGGAVKNRTAVPPRPGEVPAAAAPAAPADFDLGYKAFQEGRFEDAVRHLSAAAPQMQGNSVYHLLGASYVKIGQFDTGIAALIRANAFKEESNTYDWLGLAYRSNGNFAESARCYQKALSMAPDNPTLYYGLGIASYWMGWIPESIQAIEMGLQKASDPQDKQGLFEVQSWLYASRGMYPEVYGLAGERHQIGGILAQHAEGLEVVRQMRGFPADAAGLRPGDVLTSFNGSSLKASLGAFVEKILPDAAFGSKATVRFLRAGREYETEVIIGVPPNFATLAKASSGPRPVSGAPYLKLVKLAVTPPVVSPGQNFDLQIDYAATGQATGPGGLDVQLGFSILEGGKVSYTERPVSLGAPSGALQTRLQHLTAARKTGTYTVRVSLRCRDLTAEDSVNFTIR